MVARRVVLTANYVPISLVGKTCEVTMLAAADNSGVAYIRSDDGHGTSVEIPKGVPFPLQGVDLSQIQLRGTAGDVVIFIGV